MGEKYRENYRVALAKTLTQLSPKERVSLEDIGQNHQKLSLDRLIQYFMQAHCENSFDAVNYLAHYGSSTRWDDVISVGFPEYALEELAKARYFRLRMQKVFIPTNEEILKKAFEELKSKNSPRKIKKLKERLGIQQI